MFIIIAMAMAVSAAAMAMANNVKKKPSSSTGYKYLLNTTKFISTAFNINSNEIRIANIFFRAMKPYTPAKNITPLTSK